VEMRPRDRGDPVVSEAPVGMIPQDSAAGNGQGQKSAPF